MSARNRALFTVVVAVTLVFALAAPADAANYSISTLTSYVRTLRSQMVSVIKLNTWQTTYINLLRGTRTTQTAQIASLMTSRTAQAGQLETLADQVAALTDTVIAYRAR